MEAQSNQRSKTMGKTVRKVVRGEGRRPKESYRKDKRVSVKAEIRDLTRR